MRLAGLAMPRVKPLSTGDMRERRRRLQEDIEAGGLPTAEALCRMREALGMTQARFAQTFKLTARQVWELEAGKSNPTRETLNRLAKPFGFETGFVVRKKDKSSPD
jgi:DNA-binding XRE family transcriptional regulator